MSDKKIVVPDGMFLSVDEAISKTRGIGCDITGGQVRDVTLEAALRWLYDELDSLERVPYDNVMAHQYNSCIADVRRMFLAPEPEVPEEIADILWGEFDDPPTATSVTLHARKLHNKSIIEAFRRGKESK